MQLFPFPLPQGRRGRGSLPAYFHQKEEGEEEEQGHSLLILHGGG